MSAVPLSVLVEARDMLNEIHRMKIGQAIDLPLWIRLNHVKAVMHAEVETILAGQKVDVLGPAP